MADGSSVGDVQQEKSSEEFSPQILTLSQMLSDDRVDKSCHMKETEAEGIKLKQDKSTDTGDDQDILENIINSMTTLAGLKEETCKTLNGLRHLLDQDPSWEESPTQKFNKISVSYSSEAPPPSGIGDCSKTHVYINLKVLSFLRYPPPPSEGVREPKLLIMYKSI